MIIAAVVSLILGIFCGQFIFTPNTISLFSNISEYALMLLMFCVGISIGENKLIFRKMREYNIRILVIPAGIVFGSMAGGVVSSMLLGMPLRESLCISSGLGWYSLSGVLLTELISAEIGTIAFLSNIFREILTFICIPVIAKYLNGYTAIAPAGATSSDTALPVVIKYTNEEVTMMSVINGIICTALIPVLINTLYAIFS